MEKEKRQYECETKLIYSLICAGKSANFADKAMRKFIIELARETKTDYFVNHGTGEYSVSKLPFDMLRELRDTQIGVCLSNAKTGNYSKILRALIGILCWSADLNFETCTPEDLEKIHGIGPKTSRFFIMWIRPDEQYAALDVHILRWMYSLGYDVPKSTPQNMTRYRQIEQWFIAEAKKREISPRQLDIQIWEAGANRTQQAATPA